MASADRTRPSLLGTAPAPQPPRDFELSILDALNAPEAPAPGRAARRPRRHWAQGVLALGGLGAAVTAAVMLWTQLQAAPADADSEPAAVARTEPRAAMPAASATPAVAARIENVNATPPSAAAAPSPFDTLAALPVAAAVPAPTDAETTRDKRVTRPSTTRREARTSPATQRSPATTKSTQPTRSAASSTSRPSGTGTPARTARAATPAADADVEIMAALISHMDESATAANGANPEASIADLVRRCRALPGAEAQACQRRICQGYWGRAEACPAPRDRPTALRSAG